MKKIPLVFYDNCLCIYFSLKIREEKVSNISRVPTVYQILVKGLFLHLFSGANLGSR